MVRRLEFGEVRALGGDRDPSRCADRAPGAPGRRRAGGRRRAASWSARPARSASPPRSISTRKTPSRRRSPAASTLRPSSGPSASTIMRTTKSRSDRDRSPLGERRSGSSHGAASGDDGDSDQRHRQADVRDLEESERRLRRRSRADPRRRGWSTSRSWSTTPPRITANESGIRKRDGETFRAFAHSATGRISIATIGVLFRNALAAAAGKTEPQQARAGFRRRRRARTPRAAAARRCPRRPRAST